MFRTNCPLRDRRRIDRLNSSRNHVARHHQRQRARLRFRLVFLFQAERRHLFSRAKEAMMRCRGARRGERLTILQLCLKPLNLTVPRPFLGIFNEPSPQRIPTTYSHFSA